jgi:hypothetical protein
MSEFYTYDDWAEKFQPVKNHLVKYDQLQFETYGEEQDYVFAQPNENVWTEVDGDDGTYIIAGKHFVNRIQYYITTNPWNDEFTEVPTWMEKQCDCQELLDIDLESPVYCKECEDTDGYIQIPCETVEDLVTVYGPEANIIGKATNE